MCVCVCVCQESKLVRDYILNYVRVFVCFLVYTRVCVCRHGFGRRSSFLYQSDSEDLEEIGVNMKRRGPSQSSNGHVGDETYVTPFAQVSDGVFM